MSKHGFVKFALEHKALTFGEFNLKSGRKSPYFYNAGCFNTSRALSELGLFYAQAIINSGIEFDMLFGPAYKGISIVSAVALSLWKDYGFDVPFAFDRKETKDHGEGGILVGAPVEGRVLVVDDVITGGTTFKQSYDLLTTGQAHPVGLIVGLDREEKGSGDQSASSELQSEFGITVDSIISLEDLIDVLAHIDTTADLDAIRAYRDQYSPDISRLGID